MAADKRTTVRLSEKLLRRARKTLKASTNQDAVTKALHESLVNREIQATLEGFDSQRPRPLRRIDGKRRRIQSTKAQL